MDRSSKKIQKIAKSNIQLVGFVDTMLLKIRKKPKDLFLRQKKTSIIPVEAQTCGTPVIAFGKGGALNGT